MEQVNNHVALLLTDRLKTAWKNFIEEFQQTFVVNQLDSVLSLLRELDSTSQNPTKKKRLEFMQKGDGESQDNNDDNSSSMEKKVFGNHLLAKSVFEYLSDSDLLSCRLMNSYWNEYATENLLKSDLKIKFGTRGNRFYLRESNWKSLDMFTELLKRSTKFPCNKFGFFGGNLGNDDAQRFFAFYGSCIKSLQLSFRDGQFYNKDVADSEKGFSPYLTDSRVIGMILSQQLPNLEDLDLGLNFQGDYQWSGYKSLLFNPNKEAKLSYLKGLIYDSGRYGDDFLLRQLLVAAKNLTRFELKCFMFGVDYVSDFIATRKVKCIQDFTFPAEADELDKLEEMVQYEPKLADLYLENLMEFYDQPGALKRISMILTKLLESSKNSLTNIQSFNSLGFLPNLQLPILENVTHLGLELTDNMISNVEDFHDHSFSLLPRGATFSRNLPRLNSLYFEFESDISSEDSAEWWSRWFSTDEIVPTVTYLKVSGRCPILWMEKFSQVFPNLDSLVIFGIKDFPKFSKILWTRHKRLKRLFVTIDLSSPLNFHPALDSSFTGLSPEVCKKLETFSSSVLESVAENYMENEPSLLNLTELRTLQINLEFSDASNYKFSPILTPLTGICVLKPMESLREVNIKFPKQNLQKMAKKSIIQSLELLTPYKVKIQTTK